MFGDERDRTNTGTSRSALRYRDIAEHLIISESMEEDFPCLLGSRGAIAP